MESKINMISVIIPLYNKEKFIKRTIESVLAQTYPNFELLVIDDGSTDNSVRMVNQINDSRIKLHSNENMGVSYTRNEGIKLAEFNYVAFIDADDTWHKNYLNEINKLINLFPDAGAYGTGYKFKYANGDESTPKFMKDLKKNKIGIIDDYFKLAIKDPLLTASSITIRKEIFDKIDMFKVNLNRGEDLEMWGRIALEYDIAFSSKILATYYSDISDRKNTSPLKIKKTFSYYSEAYYSENKNKPNASIFFKRYMYQATLSKANMFLISDDKLACLKTLFPLRTYYFTRKLFWRIIAVLFLNYGK